MKRITLITLGACLAGLCSCTYEYEMPDLSNLSPSYSIVNEPSSILLDEWEKIVNEEYHLNLSNPKETQWKYVESRWEWIVTEKDLKGNILYEGEPRSYADNETYSIDIAYICYVRLNRRDEYLEYARFKMPQSYCLKRSPLPTIIDVNEESKNYVLEFPPESERVYAYNVQCDDGIYKLLSSQGLSFSHSDIMVTEKDENNNILYSGDIEMFYGLEDYHISAKGTITVEVQINLDQGILYFNEKFELKDFGNQTLILSTDNDYTFVHTEPENYMYDIDYSSDIHELMVNMAKSVGYDDLYDFTINVIEKDKDGNILYQGEKPGNHGELGLSQKGAKFINIYIDFYGYHRELYPFEDATQLGTIIFSEAFELAEIQNQILTLTTQNPYSVELVPKSDLTYIYSVTYESDILNLMRDMSGSFDLSFYKCEINITEKDGNGNVLYQGIQQVHQTHATSKGTQSIEIYISVYGKGNIKVGVIRFNEAFTIDDINNQLLTLTTACSYTIEMNEDIDVL